MAFCGGGGVDDKGRLVVFFTEDDSIIRTATWQSANDLVRFLLKFDGNGNTLETSRFDAPIVH